MFDYFSKFTSHNDQKHLQWRNNLVKTNIYQWICHQYVWNRAKLSKVFKVIKTPLVMNETENHIDAFQIALYCQKNKTKSIIYEILMI